MLFAFLIILPAFSAFWGCWECRDFSGCSRAGRGLVETVTKSITSYVLSWFSQPRRSKKHTIPCVIIYLFPTFRIRITLTSNEYIYIYRESIWVYGHTMLYPHSFRQRPCLLSQKSTARLVNRSCSTAWTADALEWHLATCLCLRAAKGRATKVAKPCKRIYLQDV